MPTCHTPEYNPAMSNPRRGVQVTSGDADAALDVGETLDELTSEGFFDKTRIAAGGLDADGVPMSPSLRGGTMRRRPGIDDEEDRDTDPDGWVMPEWE